MGLFKKKSDPLSERGKELERRIAELEEEIRRTQEMQSKADASHAEPRPPPAHFPALDKSQEPIPRPSGPAPRLRSTAHPHGQTILNPKAGESPRPGAPHEPIFEEVKQNPFRDTSPSETDHAQELGIRRDDLASTWQRLKNHFRGPATSNPKLVNYLAAGSIQGLRPLRYERRVARNRFIVLVVVLVLILWGVLALLLRR